ncbi:Hypothetical predicted protein, partial [Olea europaea subsp. europaea]
MPGCCLGLCRWFAPAAERGREEKRGTPRSHKHRRTRTHRQLAQREPPARLPANNLHFVSICGPAARLGLCAPREIGIVLCRAEPSRAEPCPASRENIQVCLRRASRGGETRARAASGHLRAVGTLGRRRLSMQFIVGRPSLSRQAGWDLTRAEDRNPFVSSSCFFDCHGSLASGTRSRVRARSNRA